MADDTDGGEYTDQFLRRCALVEIDAGNGVRFVAMVPIFDETGIRTGEQVQAAVTIRAIAEGIDGCLALALGWRELHIQQQIKAVADAAADAGAVRH